MLGHDHRPRDFTTIRERTEQHLTRKIHARSATDSLLEFRHAHVSVTVGGSGQDRSETLQLLAPQPHYHQVQREEQYRGSRARVKNKEVAQRGEEHRHGEPKRPERSEARDHDQEDHQRRVVRDQDVERLRVEVLVARLCELRAEEHRQESSDDEEKDDSHQVLNPDHLVVGVDAEVVPPALCPVPFVQVGPSLDQLKAEAARAHEALAAFIKESIVDPNKYVEPGYQPGVMPPNFAQTIPSGKLDALVQYLAGHTNG